MRISKKVDELYRLHGTYNPTALADFLEIQIRYVPFLSNPDGQFINMVDKPIILINEKLRESPKRFFVIAHELFHAIEHSDLAGYYVANDKFRGKLESEANKFAASLIFRFHIDKTGDMPYSFEKMQLYYGISEDISNYLLDGIAQNNNAFL